MEHLIKPFNYITRVVIIGLLKNNFFVLNFAEIETLVKKSCPFPISFLLEFVLISEIIQEIAAQIHFAINHFLAEFTKFWDKIYENKELATIWSYKLYSFLNLFIGSLKPIAYNVLRIKKKLPKVI